MGPDLQVYFGPDAGSHINIGILIISLGDESLPDALEYLAGLGVDAVELGCGGFVGDAHLSREEYLDEEEAQGELLELVAEHDLRISALATHNNPLHPDEDRAERAATWALTRSTSRGS